MLGLLIGLLCCLLMAGSLFTYLRWTKKNIIKVKISLVYLILFIIQVGNLEHYLYLWLL